jgi:outer membrane protein TolC
VSNRSLRFSSAFYPDIPNISELQYREGTIDILSLLNNQQLQFAAQQSLVQTKLARLEADIGLYNALVGGWDQKTDDAYKNQLDWWPL